MTLSLSIARKLQYMMQQCKPLPASELKSSQVSEMIDEGVLQKIQKGRGQAVIAVPHSEALLQYLRSHFGIQNLDAYVAQYASLERRSDAIEISGNSKLTRIRTFTGFPVTCYHPIEASIKGKPFLLHPGDGTSLFIHDFTSFTIPPGVTVVGIENSENFMYVRHQQYLFDGLKPLFVSRYPQGKDLLQWLQSVPNPYLHFGDLDFEGINIYLNEYKKPLKERAMFLVPPHTEALLAKYGNRDLYNLQAPRFIERALPETSMNHLLSLFHRYKKVLEQEIFISNPNLT